MTIFTHVTLGTNNFDAAVTFYDAVLGALGINNLGKLHDTAMMYGKKILRICDSYALKW